MIVGQAAVKYFEWKMYQGGLSLIKLRCFVLRDRKCFWLRLQLKTSETIRRCIILKGMKNIGFSDEI